ncbi:hypothetical protein BDZ91DRAFT_753901 [Kalaharituber pfeilii]|nr:hypothetical protein BDZ91DRAFT_753901 [Kalaharituber pfeilii]
MTTGTMLYFRFSCLLLVLFDLLLLFCLISMMALGGVGLLAMGDWDNQGNGYCLVQKRLCTNNVVDEIE